MEIKQDQVSRATRHLCKAGKSPAAPGAGSTSCAVRCAGLAEAGLSWRGPEPPCASAGAAVAPGGGQGVGTGLRGWREMGSFQFHSWIWLPHPHPHCIPYTVNLLAQHFTESDSNTQGISSGCQVGSSYQKKYMCLHAWFPPLN